MKSLAHLAASLALALLLAACDSGKGSSADPPTDFKVVAGDAAVIITWTAEPEVGYWVFYGPGTGITTANWASTGGRAITGATSPQIITGLLNGTTYSFTINGRRDGGPGGPGAPTVVATPVLSGTNWVAATPLGTEDLRSASGALLLSGTVLITAGTNGALYSSVAGGAFTPRTNPAAPADLNALWYTGPGFVAVGTGGNAIFSTDGVAWTKATTGTTATLHGCGSTAANTFIAFGASGTMLASSDGLSWSPAASGTARDLHATTFGVGRLVVVGDGGTVLTSTDNGATWAASTAGTADLRSVAYGLIPATATTAAFNRFVAVGKGGAFLTSADGLSWTAQPSFTPSDLHSVTYGGQFVAVGAGGVLFTSLEGIDWRARASSTTNALNDVLRTPISYLAVGDKGTIVSSN